LDTDPLKQKEAEPGVIDLTNTSSDEASVIVEATADPLNQKGKENQAMLTEGLFSFTHSPPITPKDVRKTKSSPTIAQLHSMLTFKMAESAGEMTAW
jgi:hypothetical protein